MPIYRGEGGNLLRASVGGLAGSSNCCCEGGSCTHNCWSNAFDIFDGAQAFLYSVDATDCAVLDGLGNPLSYGGNVSTSYWCDDDVDAILFTTEFYSQSCDLDPPGLVIGVALYVCWTCGKFSATVTNVFSNASCVPTDMGIITTPLGFTRTTITDGDDTVCCGIDFDLQPIYTDPAVTGTPSSYCGCCDPVTGDSTHYHLFIACKP